MERGTLRLTIDGTPYTLRAGDSIYYAGDCWHAFANPGRETCAYYLAMELAQHAARPVKPRGRRKREGTRRRP
jgi:quercetin dioxygenase-like cupin family protein